MIDIGRRLCYAPGMISKAALVILSLFGLLAVAAPQFTTTDPSSVDAANLGFRQFFTRCSDNGGPLLASRIQDYSPDKGFYDSGQVRVICGDVEMTVPMAWLDAGLGKQ